MPMQAGTSFGRKRTAPAIRAPKPLETADQSQLARPVPIAAQTDAMERELKDWNRARKARARLLAEPWRSMSIAASVGFGVSSWVLPDAVQDVVQITLGILMAGGLIAARRKSKRLALDAGGESGPIPLARISHTTF
jgi:hypothetical protein